MAKCDPDPVHPSFFAGLQLRLEATLAVMPPEERQVIESLCGLSDDGEALSFAGVAEKMNMTVQEVKERERRAFQGLR